MKLFIGNLSFDTTEAELRAVFEPYEPVLEYIRPTNRETGQPRGFAFVTLLNAEVGNTAIEALNGMELGGRNITVNEAEDRGFSRPSPPRMDHDHHDALDKGPKKRVDDRPVGKNGKKVVYKSI